MEATYENDLPIKILVIDDSKLIHVLIDNIFKERNYHLIHANNGKEALMLFEQNIDVKIVLLDIELPDINGFELAKTIRSSSKAPILVQTGSINEEFNKKLSDNNLNHCITKPFTRQSLLDKVEELIG